MLEEKGVEFHLNAGVKEIVVEDGKVRWGKVGSNGKLSSGFLGNGSDAAIGGDPVL